MATQLERSPRTIGHRHRPEWPRAYRALRTLLRDPSRTEQAFEVFDALEGDTTERRLHAMLAFPEGRRLFTERPSLLEVLGEEFNHLPVVWARAGTPGRVNAPSQKRLSII